MQARLAATRCFEGKCLLVRAGSISRATDASIADHCILINAFGLKLHGFKGRCMELWIGCGQHLTCHDRQRVKGWSNKRVLNFTKSTQKKFTKSARTTHPLKPGFLAAVQQNDGQAMVQQR